jgi:hypothetical protein
MSDLGPESPDQQQPADASEAPPEIAPPEIAPPAWAMPAIPPAPEAVSAPTTAEAADSMAQASPDATAAEAPDAATSALPFPAQPPAPPRGPRFDRARWLPTVAVAAVIAGVVLGGMGIDGVLAAPSAGTLDLGGSVTITGAPGWTLTSDKESTTSLVVLKSADAVLIAQVVMEGYGGTPAEIMVEAQADLRNQTAQISFGDVREGIVGGNRTSYASFQATVTSGDKSGIVDGEVVCMVVGGNAVIVEVAAPQGRLDAAIDDVTAMLKSVRVAR